MLSVSIKLQLDQCDGGRTKILVSLFTSSSCSALSDTLSVFFLFFLVLSSDCSITGRGSGGLDGPDFSAGPQTFLFHLPTLEPPSQSLCTLLSARHKPGGQNKTAKTGRDSSHWRNKIFVSYNHFGNMTLPPTRRQRQPTEHSVAPGWT